MLSGFRQEDVANAAGSTRQTVSTELKRLGLSGFVRREHKLIEIIDRDALKDAAETHQHRTKPL